MNSTKDRCTPGIGLFENLRVSLSKYLSPHKRDANTELSMDFLLGANLLCRLVYIEANEVNENIHPPSALANKTFPFPGREMTRKGGRTSFWT